MKTVPDEIGIINITKLWIENAVIGLNLCPFAKSVYLQNSIRFFVSRATETKYLAEDLRTELNYLHNERNSRIETTLLIHPFVLENFLDQNDFLDTVDELLENQNWVGIFQVANFHPQFMFGDRKFDDITNNVNRSPFPILHLLREEGVERAIDSHPNVESIYHINKVTLRKLGKKGWEDLLQKKE